MNRAGFSLLEVLLALIIAALVMAALAPALTGSLRAQRQAWALLDPLAAEQAALSLLRDDLLGAPQPVGTLAQPFTVAASTVDGHDAATLSFTTDCPPPLHPSLAVRAPEVGQALIVWRVRTADDGVGVALVRTRQPHLLATGTPPVPVDEVLIDHLANLSIDVLDAGAWAPAYDSSQRNAVLPGAVRMRFAYRQADGTAGPQRMAVVPLPQVALDPIQQAGGG